MKKIILLQILFLFITVQLCKAQADKPKITFKVKIASPRKGCDSGLNFCVVYDIYGFRNVDANISVEENKIQFQLLRSSMNENLENELLQAIRFPIEEGTILPMDICHKIGMREETTLKQGFYPIQISDDYITITCAIE